MRPAPDKHTLSYQLRELIASRGLTAYALAELAGVDRRALSRWLNEEKDLNLTTADKIATALGIRLAEVASRRRRA